MPLKQRAVFFHRRFPDRRISAKRLSFIYREHKISLKHFKTEKLPPSINLTTYFGKVHLCRQQLIQVAAKGLPIVYCDQTLFTRHSIKHSTYSRAYQHYHLSTSAQYTAPTWGNGFICKDRGLVHVQTY